METDRQVAAQLLLAVLDGEMDPETAEQHFFDLRTDDRSLNTAMHALQHFRADADIRAKDPRYADYQISELRKIADSLSRDEDVDQDIVDWFEPRTGCLLGLFGTGRSNRR